MILDRLRVSGQLDLSTEVSLQIIGRVRYPLCLKHRRKKHNNDVESVNRLDQQAGRMDSAARDMRKYENPTVWSSIALILSKHRAFVDVGSTVISVPALRSVGTILSRVRAPQSAPRPDGRL
ncbi:hypothetical protein PoB_006546000 [Plakobranchus ocellatus]|uniref:Uncharacterized protein n=1 Tax=Plakobranchus ocellatus TaxID=259542 RepID=A0AAV4D4N6_9GAST|nr:hypothetical protein PoB_006546000 [Plakobranchus ocellatus]